MICTSRLDIRRVISDRQVPIGTVIGDTDVSSSTNWRIRALDSCLAQYSKCVPGGSEIVAMSWPCQFTLRRVRDMSTPISEGKLT